MKLDEKFVKAAKCFINTGFLSLDNEEGAASVFTSEGEMLVSTAPDASQALFGDYLV